MLRRDVYYIDVEATTFNSIFQAHIGCSSGMNREEHVTKRASTALAA